jgi:hypothetical protein
MAVWLRLTLVVGSIVAVLAVARSAPVSAQGTPVASPTPCVPVPAVNASPIAADGSFPMPICGTVVIDSTVNNGPVPPEYQQGYEITIDTGGVAIVAITHEGTPTPTVQIVNLGPDGLQKLLQQLQEIGFFGLPDPGTPGPDEPIMVGGPTNNLSVWLGDQFWQISESELSSDDLAILNEAQQAILSAVGGMAP